MGRKSASISANSGKNIKALLKAHGKSQEWLAEQLDLSPVTVSRFLTGNRMTRDRAEMIASLFPGTRIEFIMGYDEYLTQFDFVRAKAKQIYKKRTAPADAFYLLAKAQGFEFERIPDDERTPDDTRENRVIYYSNPITKISNEALDRIISNTSEYALFLLLQETNISWREWKEIEGVVNPLSRED